MIEQLTNPTVIAVGTAVLALASAAAYSYFTGNEASVDVDNDGEDEVTFGGSQNDVEAKQIAKDLVNEDAGIALENVSSIGPSLAKTLRDNGITTTDDLREATDDELLELNGIGPSKLETIRNDL